MCEDAATVGESRRTDFRHCVHLIMASAGTRGWAKEGAFVDTAGCLPRGSQKAPPAGANVYNKTLFERVHL